MVVWFVLAPLLGQLKNKVLHRNINVQSQVSEMIRNDPDSQQKGSPPEQLRGKQILSTDDLY